MAFKSRVILSVLASVGLCALVLAEAWWRHGGIVRVPLPLARGGEPPGFPLPLLTWCGVALYAAGYRTLFRIPSKECWARAIRLGVGLHLLVLVGRTAWYIAREMQADLSRWYLGYWYAVWAGVLAIGLAGIGRWIVRWRQTHRTDPWLFFAPLLGGYASCWIASWMITPRLTGGSTVAGIGLWLVGRAPIVQRWTKRFIAWFREERWFLSLVFLVALALRLFYTARVMSNPDFLNTGSDGPTYDAMAWALVRGGPPPADVVPWWSSYWFSPGYVRFLALLYTLFGRNYFLVCAVQSAIGAGACVLLYAVAKRLFTPPTARLAAAFAALNFQLIFAAAAIGHQALDLFWTLLVVWSLVRYVEDPARWGRRLFGIGLLLGWAAATREGNFALWLFLIGFFLVGMRAKVGWQIAWQHLAILSLGFVLVLLPFVWGTVGGLHGRLELQWFYYQYTPTPINSWFNPWRDPTAAWALFHAQPLTVLVTLAEGVVANFAMIFLDQAYGAFDPVFLVRWSPYYYAMWGYAYGLAFTGLWLVVREAWRQPVTRLGWWLLLTVLVSRALPHLFFQATYRHRTPMEPYLILLAAYGLTCLLRAGRQGRAA